MHNTLAELHRNERKLPHTIPEMVNCFSSLSMNAKDLYLPKEIPVEHEIPNSLQFYRTWVAANVPFKIKGGIKNWPAVKKWNKEFFCKTLRDKMVSVAVTPNGYADAITETVVDDKTVRCFALPEERLVKFSEFLHKLDGGGECTDPNVKASKGIFYIQKQNSNLTEEFPELLPDIDEQLSWASEAFDSKPAAINLWIGDERAVTSLHKDHFENIYCVVSGYKDFILIPPTDRPWLPYKKFPVGQYRESSPAKFDILLHTSNKWMTTDGSDCDLEQQGSDYDEVPWIDIDPLKPDYGKYPSYSKVTPLRVRVEKGDILYLPSLWFHHVSQSQGCIAVNYWYEMNFDIKFAYYQFLECLTDRTNRI